MPEQLTFDGGLNPSAAPDKLAPNEVQAAENIDFSLEPGAIRVRRGSTRLAAISTSPLLDLYAHYNDPGFSTYPRYAISGGAVYRSTNGSSYSSIKTGLSVTDFAGFSSYRGFTYIAAGAQRVKDDGTTAKDWVSAAPSSAPSVAVETSTSSTTVASVWTVFEGTIQGSGTATATGTVDGSTFRIQFDATPTTNLSTIGTATIGDYGVDYLRIRFSDPKLLKRISRDYSIGDDTYKNYWHTELDLTDVNLDLAMPTADVLIDGQRTVGSGTSTAVDFPVHAEMHSRARRYHRPQTCNISASKATFNSWAIARTRFERIGPDTTANWTNIAKCRVIVEATAAGLVVEITDWNVQGSQDFPLNDPEFGYAYWETYAALDSNNAVLWESAASPPSARTRMQAARAAVTMPNVPTGTAHGYTHKFLYRQGGFMPTPLRVGTRTGTTSGTFTDAMTDIQALSDGLDMQVNIMTAMPTGIQTVSQPFRDRIFIGYDNKIAWSLPGNPEAFPNSSVLTVSNAGDNVRKIIAWPHGLIVGNLGSIYELAGSVFEGPESDYVLQRSSSKHGIVAPRAAIPTEYGISIIHYDGLFMYQPGQGVEVPVTWFNDKFSHVFYGYGANDPAAQDGSRVPAINGNVFNACAAYREGRLFLGVPTGGTATDCNVLFVLDFPEKKAWYYTYPWNFRSLLWDFVDNKLTAGGSDGNLYQIEVGLTDANAATTPGIAWTVKSRAWTTPSDTVLENLMVEARGANSIFKGIYDGAAAVTLGTTTAAGKEYLIPPLTGTFANNVVFSGTGTQSGAAISLYQITYDALVHPPRVQFYRTPHDVRNAEGEYKWDVHYTDMEVIGTGTVLGTVFVQNTAVMTTTITGPPSDRQVTQNAFPAETYGEVAYTIYNGQGTPKTKFKHWATKYDARVEPPRINYWRTDIESLEENICDGVDVDINPNGTVTQVVFVDNTAVGTFSYVGTNRQSYTTAFRAPAVTSELFGRTLYSTYTGTAFKHYKTWFHLRLEPDRWTNYISNRESMDEAICDGVDSDIDCLGNTVNGTIFIDGTAVSTRSYTGSGRQSYTNAIPNDTYGRTVWVVYNAASGTFKHYRTWFHKRPEPDRWQNYVTDRRTTPSDNYAKTLVVDMNPLGTVFGTVFANSTSVGTATFTGTNRTVFNWGFPNVSAGAVLHVIYNAQGTGDPRFKHYNTDYEVEPKPFLKKNWVMTYKKVGGATQLDMPRFYDLDIDADSGTATVTCTWKIDGATFQTDTHTFTARHYRDRLPFKPGGHGYLFQVEMTSSQDFRVWKSNMDIERIGVKGLSRFTVVGRPVE